MNLERIVLLNHVKKTITGKKEHKALVLYKIYSYWQFGNMIKHDHMDLL